MRRDRTGNVSRRGARRPVLLRSTLAVRVLATVSLLALAGTLAGCGALFGSRYNNFRAYYNTFYNARRAFDEGERALRRPDQRIDRGRFLPLFPSSQVGATSTPVAAGGSGGPFQQAIDKSADLLRERAGSRYADDALLLIGKSYFYTGNYVGAEQKFRETIDAATTGRQRELIDEARFWLGRTLAAQRRFDEGASVLEAALSDPEGSRGWRPRLRLALGALHADARRWDEAAASLEAALEEGGVGSELAARGHFLRAQVLEASGRSGDAAEAYGRVMRMRPPYELGYAAQLSRALALGLSTDQRELALDELRDMRRDGKHFVNRAEVELAYARVLAADRQGPEAGERFRAVLYDRTLEGGPVRGEALFRFAEYHRDVRGDLISASAYFDSAATVARTEPGREELVTIAAITGARRTADVYGAYAQLADRLARADSLLALGALDEPAFQARVAAIESERLVTWREEQRRRARERAASGFGDIALGGPATTLPGTTRIEDDSGEPPAAVPGPGDPPGAAAASGFLAYLDISRVQATQLAFERLWGVRPLVPNWRRREAIGGAIASGPGLDAETGPEGATDLDRPPPLDVGAVPRTPEAQALIRTERAGLRYEIGNVLFLSIADAESAAEWYRLVVDEDAGTPVAVRALYALAEVETSRGRQDEAQALYRRVLDAGADGDLAAQARERLGIAGGAAGDAGDALVADSAYAVARRDWLAGRYAIAVEKLLDVAVDYPDAPAAPRALLGAGVAYSEWSVRDSLSLDAIPDSLVPRALLDAVVRDSLAPTPEPAPRDRVAPPPSDGDSLISNAGDPAPRDTSIVSAPTPDSLLSQPVRPLPAGPAFGVVDIYTLLLTRYPGTPYAERATALRAALTADDVTPADTGEGLAATPPSAAGVGERPRAALSGLMGDAAIDPSLRGFTWRVARVPTGLGARALLRNFQRRGFRTAATVDVGDDGQPVYSVVVGQFESLEDAESVRDGLPVTGLGAELEVLPLETLVLLDETQLMAQPSESGGVED